MAEDFDIEDNPEWTEENTRPLDLPAKLAFVRVLLEMNQADFAALLGIPVGTLRNWEQRRTEPDAIARTLIELVYEDPQGMRERLARRSAA